VILLGSVFLILIKTKNIVLPPLSCHSGEPHLHEKFQSFLHHHEADNHSLAAGAVTIRPRAKVSVDFRRTSEGSRKSQVIHMENEDKKITKNDKRSEEEQDTESESSIVTLTHPDIEDSSDSEPPNDRNKNNLQRKSATSTTTTIPKKLTEEQNQKHETFDNENNASDTEHHNKGHAKHEKDDKKQNQAKEKATNTQIKEKGLAQVVLSRKFWCLFIIYFVMHGSGNVIINSVPLMVYSRYPPTTINTTTLSTHMANTTGTMEAIIAADVPEVNTFVILFSVFNSFSRIFGGVASDKFNHYFAAPTWIIISPIFMTVAHLCFAFGAINIMYLAQFCVGIGYGLINCYLPYLVGKLFGPTTFPENWSLILLGPAISTLLFSTVLAGLLPDYFQNQSSICVIDSTGQCNYYCYGYDCFMWVEIVLSVFSFVCIPVAVYFWWLTQEHGKN